MNTQMNGNGKIENNNSNQSTNTGSVNKPGNRENPRMKDFFKTQLKDIYWAEKKLVSTLPKMQDAATSKQLKNAFSSHLEQTKQHVERLEKVFNMLGEKPEAEKCPAMAGIVSEGENLINETHDDTALRDVGLIFAGQKAEHYEIATYGGIIALAKSLGKNDIADVLYKTLTEEEDTDKLLTQIAEKNINYKASHEMAEA